jgi:hypothetical protein
MLEIGCGDGGFFLYAQKIIIFNFIIFKFWKEKLQQKFNKDEILIHIGEVYDLKQTTYN